AALGGTRLPNQFDPLALQKSYGSVLRDLFGLNSPSWTASLNIPYPIGTSQADANLARTRLQYSQSQTRLKNQQLQVATQVRQQARNVQTNQQSGQSTRAARRLRAAPPRCATRRSSGNSRPARPRASWSSRRSPTSRRPATTNCARFST